MFKKLFLVFLVLNILGVAVLAIRFPSKNESRFQENDGMRVENYHKRHWELLPSAEWGFDPAPPTDIGCGPTGSHSSGVRRFVFIGIVEKEGWQATEEEWERVQKIREKK